MRRWVVNRFLLLLPVVTIGSDLILRKALWEVSAMMLAGAFAIVLFID